MDAYGALAPGDDGLLRPHQPFAELRVVPRAELAHLPVPEQRQCTAFVAADRGGLLLLRTLLVPAGGGADSLRPHLRAGERGRGTDGDGGRGDVGQQGQLGDIHRGGRELEAGSGGEILQGLTETDEGAARLGEIALVPHSSPISQSGILFYNTLYDENASCHLALGRAYKIGIKDGADLDDEAFEAAGGNISLIHIDFMIGSNALDVDGLMADGATEPVMRGGEWAFDV